MFKKILCPIDGSDHARKAEKLAIDLARTNQAELIFLHSLLRNADPNELERFARVEHLTKVVEPELSRLRSVAGRLDYGFVEPPSDTSRAYAEIGQSLLESARMEATAEGIKTIQVIMTDGDAADQILRTIEQEGVDCVVIGSRGLTDLSALVLGSVSHKVLNRTPCTCIVVK